MAIASRQVSNLIITEPSLQLEPITTGDKFKINATYDSDSNSYLFGMTLPTITEPEPTEPEPIEDPTPTTVYPLIYYSPEQIVSAVRAGKASEYWSVGDVVPIALSSFKLTSNSAERSYFNAKTYHAVVLGFDHNLERETPDVNHSMTFAIMKTADRSNTFVINTNNENAPFAFVNSMTYCQYTFEDFSNHIFAALPSSWKSVIIDTTKTGVFFNGTQTQKIFTLSYYEAYGDNNGTIYEEDYADGAQQQYEFFNRFSFPINFNALLDTNWVCSSDYGTIVASRSRCKAGNVRSIQLLIPTSETYCRSYTSTWIKGTTYQMSSQAYNFSNVPYYTNASATVRVKVGTTYQFVEPHPGIIPCFTIG